MYGIQTKEEHARREAEFENDVKMHGTQTKGVVSHIEFASTENVIGQYYKDGKWNDTRRVAIHYEKKASHTCQWRD